MTTADILFRPDLLAKYSANGPRYTSYPTALQFRDDFDSEHYARAAADPGAAETDLSLYFHIPFCDTVCFYCGCNKVATKNRSRAKPYLEQIRREIELQAQLFDTARPVSQLHWGGGTPTFLSLDQMSELMAATRDHFRLRPDNEGEYSIEIDPREASADTIVHLRALGFNRLSLGVQDFDPIVQQAINRVQPLELTEDVIGAARASGFQSVSVDLIYGLPHQTVGSFARTLDTMLSLAPDRLSVFGYAHMPHLFKMQRQMDAAALPSPQERLALLRLVTERLTAAGYVYIGMDHFALPTDELARAQAQRTLHRNFQGYSTRADCDLIGFGASSIGKVGDVYVQNAKDLPGYAAAIGGGRLALTRGVRLTADDRLRRDIITELMCNLELRFDEVEAAHCVHFPTAFAPELERLREFEKDGLVARSTNRIEVLPAGRMLVRNIAMVFDRYLGAQRAERFSRTV
ncbi:oxygen-independent coproporphyrinogen III oxidase [Paraburkholderia caballeronis]|uniref:Coproporphyrinogen-III oxidase n=1 Tax=Paraburkholderia caballeronis TaxID=416943 RepID=A0A1H7TK28_9BURK|nr:oxygen-independent coproporphyrinogen III oxidase [Paraburkholderia caballeronis]PXW18425.1 oxygen-independent coproporphyrinogen-3 oxidase [Paraburkholderia caballeronis]PXW95705.1 oxygen-independent coproporphyrinogen-3 oxidase [Paraburkholderia caballeronis]RAJ92051.1 oxygen-independent coproporphyrinogen-3 oxidase [Paraburkholderia caballeronis]TDV25083.1 oxygen-independent coproporphyrinogen-3 oxidase [Paraburkholderia caballeronis]SEB76551.1 oxygen-independent coproporphyrinogen-3 oxi